MEFSVSTAWNALRINTAREMIRELASLGFQSFELNIHLDEPMLEEILAMRQAGELRVTSLHNFCPVPPGVPRDKAGGGQYLASPDELRRKRAVELTLRTLDWATRLEAQAIVVHLGHVEMQDRMSSVLQSALAGDPGARELLKEDMSDRAQRASRHMEAALKSVRELASYTGSGGPRLGFECRVSYTEIPSFDEFAAVLSEVPPEAGGYWHDFGHAQIQQLCGLQRHERYLEAYGERLIGMHIHDVTAAGRDHNALTRGTIDFPNLLSLVRDEALAVFEIHSNTPAFQLVRSRELFRAAWSKR